MNKKLFLLPVLMLLLAGCGKGTSSSSTPTSSSQQSSETSSSSSSSSSSEAPAKDYGTADDPLTVTEALALCDEELEESGDWTKQELYVKGLIVNTPANKTGFSQQIKIADTKEGEQLLVYTMNHDADKAPYKNDELVVKGWVTLYSSTVEFSNKDDEYPVEVALTRKESSITYSKLDDSITFDATNPAKGINASTFDFKVSGTAGKELVVKVNGEEVTAAEGKYTGTVKGDTTVVVDYAVSFESVELKYSGSTTNMAADTNEAAKLGLDATKWSVVGIKNAPSNNVGLNKDGSMRLYNEKAASGNGNTIQIKPLVAGVKIKRVELNFASTTVATAADVLFQAGATTVAGEAGVYTVDASVVTVQNHSASTSSAQMHFSSIVVYYA
jgi:hypothetical protein